MADYTLQELKDIQAEYLKAQADGIPISKELAQRYKDAAVGIKNYSRQLEGSLKQFGSSLLSSIVSSDRGAAKYNGALTSGADALSDYMMKFGPLGIAAGLATKGLTAFATAVTKQSDALFKTYQDLSQTGVTGAAGIRGVFENLQDFGYTVDKINEYTSLMQSNSDTLVRFGGSANEGAARMGDVVKAIRDSGAGKNLRLLGMSSEAIASSTLAYARLQATIGQSQKMTDEELIEGGTAYAEELLNASKKTGLSLKDQMDADQRAVTDAQLGSYLSLEYEKALAVGTKDALDDYENRKKLILYENRVMEGRSKELGEAYRSLRAGGTLNEKALAALRTVPGAAAAIARGASMDEIAALMKKDIEAYGTSLNTINQVTGENKNFMSVQSRNQMLDNRAEKEKTAAANAENKVTDSATKGLRDLDISQQNITQALDSLVNIGITPVTATLATFSQGLDTLLSPSKWFSSGTNKEAGTKAGGEVKTETGGGAAMVSSRGLKRRTNNDMGPKPEEANLPVSPSSAPTVNVPNAEAPKVPSSATSPISIAPTPPTKEVNSSAPNPTAPNTPGADSKPQAAMGGILSGPRSGYSATLHGTEAVVPLPDGKTIPVNMPDLSGVLNDQSELLSGVLSTLDSIVKNMENQVSVSKKILQRQM